MLREFEDDWTITSLIIFFLTLSEGHSWLLGNHGSSLSSLNEFQNNEDSLNPFGAATWFFLSQDFPIALPTLALCKDAESLGSPSKGVGKVAAPWKMQGIWKQCPEAVMCSSDQLADYILFSHSFIPSRHPWFLFQPWVVMTSSSGIATEEKEWGPSQQWPVSIGQKRWWTSSRCCCQPSSLLSLWGLLILIRGQSAVQSRSPRVNTASKSRNIGAPRRQSLLIALCTEY